MGQGAAAGGRRDEGEEGEGEGNKGLSEMDMSLLKKSNYARRRRV